VTIMDRTTGAESVGATKVCTAAEIVEMQRLARAVPDRPARDRVRSERARCDTSRQRARTRPRPGVRPLRRLAARRPGARDRGKIYALLDGRFNVSTTTSGPSPCPRCATGSSSTSRARPRDHDRVRPSARSSTPSPSRRSSSETERAERRPAARPRHARGRHAPGFLPSEVDPTVFDEAFLRQLERLLLIMRSPVRGGLKGGAAASSAASRSSSPTTASTRWATTSASLTGTSTRRLDGSS
jgi:hypothetical protein